MPEQKVDNNLCTGAGICVEVCPVNVYELKDVDGSKKSVPVRGEDCIGCRACEVQCPNGAITIVD